MLTRKENHKPAYRWDEDATANCAAQNLQLAIEHILNSHLLLSCFEAAEHFGVKIEVDGRLPLVIRKDGKNLTVGSFYWEGGSECADPAVDLEIGKCGAWYPINVQLTDEIRSCMDGPLSIDFDEREKQVRFCARWTADLWSYGFDTGEVTDLWGENI